MLTAPLAKLLLAAAAMLFALTAVAGGVAFRLSLTGSDLSVINQGGSSAFYPAVFRMLADGSWLQLAATNAPAELAPGAPLQLKWSETRPLETVSDVERLQPVMVRFFDQAGVGFGQISFFHTPPGGKMNLRARYLGGALQIEPPDTVFSIRATWVLWPREEGIGPISLPLRFEHHQPPALRVDWLRHGREPFRLDTGAGQPEVILLHETGKGFELQRVPGGGLQGREQRSAWLDATPKFYAASLIALAIAVSAIVLQFLRRAAP
jgi:hypothetical protein